MMNKELYARLGVPRARASLIDPVISDVGHIECLTSYLMRLQAHHGMGLKSVISEIQAKWGLEYRSTISHLLCTTAQLPISLNGSSERTAAVCAALRQLKPAADFRTMTLLQPPSSTGTRYLTPLLKAAVHWCPTCIAEAHSQSSVADFPLQWLLKGINQCSAHRRPLVCYCSHCGHHSDRFTQELVSGYCRFCKGSLGDEREGVQQGQFELQLD